MTPTLTSPLAPAATVPPRPPQTPPLTPLTATRDNPMPIDALGERIADLAARIHAATYELLVMLRKYDEGKGWNNGFLSCAHWLSWRTGIDLGAAREKVRVARALSGVPRIADALRRGTISYAKVRAITRVATLETEQRLLDVALAGTASHVERIVRAWRRTDRVIAAQEADARHLSRHLTTWIDDDGMVVLRGRLTPEIGAVLHRALQAAADQLRRESMDAPETGLVAEVTWGQRRADALGRLAEAALTADLDAGHAGDRYQVVLHVDASANPDVASSPEATEQPADGVLEVDDAAIRVSAETAQRLACDASVVTMHHDANDDILDVRRRTRTIPTAIRRALNARDTRCQFPGCSAKRCDAHHIDHWMDGGTTSLDNLVLLCRRHHRVVHEGAFTLRWRADRTIGFFYPDGAELRLAPPQPRIDVDTLAPTTERLAAQGIIITPRTLPTWDGGPLNLGYALDVLYVPPATVHRTFS
jgi:hypothetical protein